MTGKDKAAPDGCGDDDDINSTEGGEERDIQGPKGLKGNSIDNDSESGEGLKGLKGLKGSSPYNPSLDGIYYSDLLFPTAHLPLYDELETLVGLIGKEYKPIVKALYYGLLSVKFKMAKASVGHISTDVRAHLMMRQMTGTGKENEITAIRKLAEKCGWTYGIPTSLHPEQLIGKVVVNDKGKGKRTYELIDGFLDRDILILNEDVSYVKSKDPKYAETRAYLRTAKDPFTPIEKKAVDVPTEEAIRKEPKCVIFQFGQPGFLPEERINEGDIGRDIAPFIDFTEIDQSELLKRRVMEDLNDDTEEVLTRFANLINSLPTVDIFSMEGEAREVFAELSDLLYRYGMQFSSQISDYTNKKKARIQNHFLKIAAIQAALNGRDVIRVEDVEKAYIDFFEFLTLEFDLIEKYAITLRIEDSWYGATDEDRACLAWLFSQGATSKEKSNVSIAEFKKKIEEYTRLTSGGAEYRYIKYKKNRWISAIQIGQYDSRVWLGGDSPLSVLIYGKEYIFRAYARYFEYI